MMAVINNAYAHVSSSLFSVRFQRSIEEMLVSPIYPGFLLVGFVFSGVLRSIIVALLVFIVTSFFVHIDFSSLPMTMLVVTLVATLFALAGFINGMLARSFDDVLLIPTFLLTPLTYLGGVFYSASMLPPVWQTVVHFNPIFYMVNALRHVMIGQDEVNMTIAMSIIGFIMLLLIGLTFFLMKKGIGLRT